VCLSGPNVGYGLVVHCGKTFSGRCAPISPNNYIFECPKTCIFNVLHFEISLAQFSIEQCSAVQCSAVQCSAVQCSAALRACIFIWDVILFDG
jgi:hypothetical protein